MHCKNWKTILPFAITFLIGSLIVINFEVNTIFNRLINGKIAIKSQNKSTELKENGGVSGGDKVPTTIDCFVCIDGKIIKEDVTTVQKSKSANKFDKRLVIISKPKANYTDLAKTNQIQGSVHLRVTFLANGTIGNIAVIESLTDGLTEQAIEAAKKIEFKPAMRGGKPISVTRQVQYTFTLY